ncbi:MAG: hypothetical protein IPF54_27850 [Draconibacterium sp.]|nr:hypothetical protein [Draconibacterium sp.]
MKLLENDAVKLIDVNFRKPYDSQEVVESLLEKTDIVKLNDEELGIANGTINTNTTNKAL